MAKYLKNDTELGYITELAEIENEKFNNLRHVVQGFMLGDFDKFGKYVISKEIVQELISMPKFLSDTIDNLEICSSALKLDKPITFVVSYEGDKVKLSILEKISFAGNHKANGGTYSNINEVVLDQIKLTGVVNKNVVYRRWNISPYSGQVLDIFNLDPQLLEKYFGIVNRFKYLLKANIELQKKEEELEEIESEEVLSKLEIIKNYPELNKRVSEDLKNAFNGKNKFVRLDKQGFAKTVNEIITQPIEINKNLLDKEKLESFNQENLAILKTINLKREKILTISDESDKVVIPVRIQESLSELASKFVKSDKTTENNSKKIAEQILKEQDKLSNKSYLIQELKKRNLDIVADVVLSEKTNVDEKTKKVETNQKTSTETKAEIKSQTNKKLVKESATKKEKKEEKGNTISTKKPEETTKVETRNFYLDATQETTSITYDVTQTRENGEQSLLNATAQRENDNKDTFDEEFNSRFNEVWNVGEVETYKKFDSFNNTRESADEAFTEKVNYVFAGDENMYAEETAEDRVLSGEAFERKLEDMTQ